MSSKKTKTASNVQTVKFSVTGHNHIITKWFLLSILKNNKIFCVRFVMKQETFHSLLRLFLVWFTCTQKLGHSILQPLLINCITVRVFSSSSPQSVNKLVWFILIKSFCFSFVRWSKVLSTSRNSHEIRRCTYKKFDLCACQIAICLIIQKMKYLNIV